MSEFPYNGFRVFLENDMMGSLVDQLYKELPNLGAAAVMADQGEDQLISSPLTGLARSAFNAMKLDFCGSNPSFGQDDLYDAWQKLLKAHSSSVTVYTDAGMQPQARGRFYGDGFDFNVGISLSSTDQNIPTGDDVEARFARLQMSHSANRYAFAFHITNTSFDYRITQYNPYGQAKLEEVPPDIKAVAMGYLLYVLSSQGLERCDKAIKPAGRYVHERVVNLAFDGSGWVKTEEDDEMGGRVILNNALAAARLHVDVSQYTTQSYSMFYYLKIPSALVLPASRTFTQLRPADQSLMTGRGQFTRKEANWLLTHYPMRINDYFALTVGGEALNTAIGLASVTKLFRLGFGVTLPATFNLGKLPAQEMRKLIGRLS